MDKVVGMTKPAKNRQGIQEIQQYMMTLDRKKKNIAIYILPGWSLLTEVQKDIKAF